MELIFLLCAFFMGLFGGRIIWKQKDSSNYPELERMATLLLASSNINEIRNFAKSKMGYLKEKTFSKLCARIEELRVDEVINEDENALKVRIATLEDKEIELKKLQAESFLETIGTIKKMCR